MPRRNSDQTDEPDDPPRETTHGRGPGHGEWLEVQLQQALEDWGYATARRRQLLALTADIVACRETPTDAPADYLVAECKDWQDRPIDQSVIVRLCLLAFVGRAMPLLCHTTRLTDRAWRLAQAFDIRLLTLEDLDRETLPPLTRQRPPRKTDIHRQSTTPRALRTTPPAKLRRFQGNRPEIDIEAPVFPGGETAPCYVPDRSGHEAYTDTAFARYRQRERRKRDTEREDL